MRRIHALLLTLATLLALTACEAPLKPKSAEDRDTAPAPSASPSPVESTPTPTTAPRRTASPKPSKVTVPSLPPKPRLVGPLLGGDISWPQCPEGMGIPEKRSGGLPLPIDEARFVVIGLTNGPGFVANPCLAQQVAYARQRHLLTAAYSVISGPSRFSPAGVTGDELGQQQARFNIASMRRAGFATPIVWLDVETVPKFDWGGDKAANAAVIRGAANAYRAAGYAVGVYSTPYLYENVAGGLRLGLPEWRAAGQTSKAEALRRCRDDWVIQGGPGVLGQWVEDGRDQNTTCPGAGDLSRYFHQY